MRTLNRTILAGGVIYPAGTEATSDLEAVIVNPDFWDGEADDPKPKTRKRAASTDSGTDSGTGGGTGGKGSQDS